MQIQRVVFIGDTTLENVKKIAIRIRKNVEKLEIKYENHKLNCTCSIVSIASNSENLNTMFCSPSFDRVYIIGKELSRSVFYAMLH